MKSIKKQKAFLTIGFLLIISFMALSLTNLKAANNNNFSFGAGATTGVFIDNNNDLYAWGYNEFMGVGTGDYSVVETTPQKLTLPDNEIPEKVFQAEKSIDHAFVISQSGRLFVFGKYDLGGLADTFTGYVETPTEIILPADVMAKEIYMPSNPTLSTTYAYAMISTNNDLYMWGNNSEGQLGTGDLVNLEAPTLVNLNGAKVEKLFYSHDFQTIAAITPAYDLYMWGNNSEGQIGLGYVGDNAASTTEITTPTLVNQVFASGVIEHIAFNDELTFYVNNVGETYVSGKFETYNALFTDQVLAADILTPVLFNPVSDLVVSKVFSSNNLGLVGFLTSDQDLYVLGETSTDQTLLNVSTSQAILNDKYKLNLADENVLDFQINDKAYMIETDQNFYMLGHYENEFYWNEDNLVEDSFYNLPEMIILPNDEKVLAADIQSGFGFYYVVSNTGNLYVRGDNYFGQLGTGDFESLSEFTLNPHFDDGSFVNPNELSDDGSFGGVVVTSPSGTLTILGLAWYWWTVIGLVVIYFLGTKKGKKTIGLK